MTVAGVRYYFDPVSDRPGEVEVQPTLRQCDPVSKSF